MSYTAYYAGMLIFLERIAPKKGVECFGFCSDVAASIQQVVDGGYLRFCGSDFGSEVVRLLDGVAAIKGNNTFEPPNDCGDWLRTAHV